MLSRPCTHIRMHGRMFSIVRFRDGNESTPVVFFSMFQALFSIFSHAMFFNHPSYSPLSLPFSILRARPSHTMVLFPVFSGQCVTVVYQQIRFVLALPSDVSLSLASLKASSPSSITYHLNFSCYLPMHTPPPPRLPHSYPLPPLTVPVPVSLSPKILITCHVCIFAY